MRTRTLPKLGAIAHLLLILSSAACASERATFGEASATRGAGSVRVALTARVGTTTYRLRNALFTLSGPQSLTLSSEDDIDAEFVSASVPAGDYLVVLGSDWLLERGTAQGYAPVDAALISDAVQSVVVARGASTTVRFRFRVNNAPTQEGVLNIGLDVEDPTLDAGVATDAGCDADSMADCGSCPAGQLRCDGACVEECAGRLRVRALIDGRSQLLVRSRSVWWRHYDYAAPGLHTPYAEPTELWSSAPGSPESHSIWCPSWPTPCNTCEGDCGELREPGIESLPFDMLETPLPSSGRMAMVALEPFENPGLISLVQEPVPANDYTLVLEFDDNAALGPHYYQVAVDYVFVAGDGEPADAGPDAADASPSCATFPPCNRVGFQCADTASGPRCVSGLEAQCERIGCDPRQSCRLGANGVAYCEPTDAGSCIELACVGSTVCHETALGPKCSSPSNTCATLDCPNCTAENGAFVCRQIVAGDCSSCPAGSIRCDGPSGVTALCTRRPHGCDGVDCPPGATCTLVQGECGDNECPMPRCQLAN